MAPASDPAPSGTLAALDVGTNSVHLVVARQVGDGGFEVLTREKETVRLGHGGGEFREIGPDAMTRAVAALARMRRIAESAGAPIRAVATSATREARNAEEFLAAAREVGVEIEVISGVEEARLIHLGVLQAVPVFDQRLILVDIGGGSTEVLVGEAGETLFARSFKLGAVRLTDRFFPGDRMHPAAVTACGTYVRSTLANVEKEVSALGFQVAIASSGTAETIARMVTAAAGRDDLRTYNCSEFTRADLDAVVERLAEAPTTAERRQVPGLDPGRADIILAGALILQGVAEVFSIDRFTFSDYALREGVLLDTIHRQRGIALHESLRDVSRNSVRRLAARCDDDPAHSEHVARLAVDLFDQTREVHGLDESSRGLLEAAALLANVGLVVSHSKHHLHSYYVIRNSELLGFTDPEIELIALIARYHRKSAPKPTHADVMRLSERDRRTVTVLAGLLRIAIGLDRSHDARVESVSVTTSRKKLTMTAHARPGADIDLELYAANERSGLLADVLERSVEVGR